jgi:hypothetical protein
MAIWPSSRRSVMMVTKDLSLWRAETTTNVAPAGIAVQASGMTSREFRLLKFWCRVVDSTATLISYLAVV